MCTEAVVWGWGNKRLCLRRNEQHDKHLADVGTHLVEWWGKVGKTQYVWTEKDDAD